MNIVAAEINDTKAISSRDKVVAFVELTKPRIAVMLVLTSAAGFYLASVGTFDVRALCEFNDRDHAACTWCSNT